MFKNWTLGLILITSLSGCSTVKVMMGRAEKPALPRVLVLTVACDNAEIGGKIAEGLLKNLTSKVEAFDPAGYELLISSITRKKAGLPPPSADKHGDDAKEPPPVLKFSSSTFYSDLAKSQYNRTKVSLETGLDYVVIGEAKEQKLSDLETGNLITAETATIKMLDLRNGEYPVEEHFKQGLFEVVAPDRIGVKFAARINRYFSSVRKQEKREEKALLRKFEE